MQRDAGSRAESSAAVLEGLGELGSGRALDPDTRASMEARFGRDFGGVRVHTDESAARAAIALSAEAFTTGQDIFFAEGRYRPRDRDGRRLLAHELTHTIQQGDKGRGPASVSDVELRVSRPSDPLELEAERVASRVADGHGALGEVSGAPGSDLQRSPDFDLPSWDDVVGAAEDAADWAEERVEGAAEWAEEKAEGAAKWAEEQAEGAAKWAKEKAEGAAEWAEEKAEEALGWLATAAGQAALDAAYALAALYGGTVTIVGTGILITIPNVELCTPRSIPVLTMPMMSVQIPLWGWAGALGPVGVGAALGVRLGIQPSLAVSYGPCRLQGISLLIDPLKSTYVGTAQLYVAGAITETAVLEGALKAIGVVGLFTPPIALMVAVEGGLRGTLRGSAVGAIEETVTIGWVRGTFGLGLVNVLMLGGLLELDLDFFANAQLYDFVVCEYVLPLGSWVLASTAERYELPITIGSGAGGTAVSVGPVTSRPIPITDIQVFINRTRPQTRCLTLDNIRDELCRRGYLPPAMCTTAGPTAPVGPTGPLTPTIATPIPIKIISGDELWWFDGERPSGYPVEQGLKADTGGVAGVFTWRVETGAGFADFGGNPDAIGRDVTLDSKSPSGGLNDVRVRVTFAGSGVSGDATKEFTVKAPDRLGFTGNLDRPDPTFGYETFVNYNIQDQFATVLPRTVPINEHFTAPPTADFPGMDWRRGGEGSLNANPSGWADHIQGETASHTPTPVAPTNAAAGVAVYHWPGTWQVGAFAIGVGRRVKSVIWQKNRGFARHL